jgi:hypothetical protein
MHRRCQQFRLLLPRKTPVAPGPRRRPANSPINY